MEQGYHRNTPVLVSRHTDTHGNAIDVIDFCPRFQRHGRSYRPVAFARVVRPVAGSPRIRVRLRPTCGWGRTCNQFIGGSNHLRYVMEGLTLRLTTTAPVGLIEQERAFRVERPLHFFLGPDESFSADVAATVDQMLDQTMRRMAAVGARPRHSAGMAGCGDPLRHHPEAVPA